MNILVFSIIIFNIHSAFGRLPLTSREIEIDELTQNLKSIRTKLFDELMKIDNLSIALVKNNTDHVLLIMKNILQNDWPVCYNIAFEELMKEITLVLQNDIPKLCFKKIRNSQKELVSSFVEYTKVSTTDIRAIRQCADSPSYCQYNPKLIAIRSRIKQFEFADSEYLNWTGDWNITKQCCTDLSSRIETILTSLRRPYEHCDWFGNYKQFLQGLSLWPLTIANLLDPNIESDPSPDREVKSSYQGFLFDYSKAIQPIVNDWNQLKSRVERYREDLESNIENITNNSLRYIDQKIFYTRVYMFDRNDSISNKVCPDDLLRHQISEITKFYTEDLHNICFQKMNDVVAHLYGLELHLSSFIKKHSIESSCWTSNICMENQFILTNVQIILDAWENFNLTETWNFAKACYGVATNTVWNNIWTDRLHSQSCWTYGFSQNVFRNLPENHIKYPNYQLK